MTSIQESLLADTQPQLAPRPVIYTDGCCGKNGHGGAAFVAHVGETLYVGVRPLVDSTTQSAELTAACMAAAFDMTELDPLGFDSPEVYSDSMYVVDGMSKWLVSWALAGWKTVNGQPVKNLDLWQLAHKAGYWHTADWHWVKGHSGVLGNELCDGLAGMAKKAVTACGGTGEAWKLLEHNTVDRVHQWLDLHGMGGLFSDIVLVTGGLTAPKTKA